ncbi:hypothetical protein GCM10023322_65610 [Rugosimonospora acidiphila]|uniref:SRPBCC domain-containing protein n=1 Tax=Rugosimonospora acidiphila TaxID=556531 RepID=A0ABP9SKB9_9ACTN
MPTTPFVRVHRDIAAPPELIWRVLTDFAGYPAWHPTLTVGAPVPEAVAGAQLRLTLTGGVAGDQAFTAEILEVRPPHRLVWSGGLPEVLLGRHTFALDALPGRGTRFTDTEEWTGTLAATVVAEHGAAITTEYQRAAAALAARCHTLTA